MAKKEQTTMGLKDKALQNYSQAQGDEAFDSLKSQVVAAIHAQSASGEERLQFTVRNDDPTRRVLLWLNNDEGIPAIYRDGMIVWEWAAQPEPPKPENVQVEPQ